MTIQTHDFSQTSDYLLLRQKRKSLSISVQNNRLIIKAPLKLAADKIWKFVNSKQKWITQQSKKQRENSYRKMEIADTLDRDDFWSRELKPILGKKVAFWSAKMGIKNLQTQIIVKKYKSKWGSCSYKKSVNANPNSNSSQEIASFVPNSIQKLKHFLAPLWAFSKDETKNPNIQKNLDQINPKNLGNKSEKKLEKIEKNSKNQLEKFAEKFEDKLEMTDNLNCDNYNFGEILTNSCVLKFNLRLGYLPDFIVDYVVVHELGHLWQPNHSALFWTIIHKVLPDYKVAQKWLKDNGNFYLV